MPPVFGCHRGRFQLVESMATVMVTQQPCAPAIRYFRSGGCGVRGAAWASLGIFLFHFIFFEFFCCYQGEKG